MYRCYNPKRFLVLLLIDFIIIGICCIFMIIGKSVFSADSIQEGIPLPIVMYHSITADETSEDQITMQMLEEDLRYLRSHGYETISIAELTAYTNSTGTLPERPVMLTFDDGFKNNLEYALPLLEQYDMCAVVSVIGYYTDCADSETATAEDSAYLSWNEVDALLDSGRIEIGSHTYNLHSMENRAGCSIMYGEDKEDYTTLLTEDLIQLQTRMQEKTGTLPIAFAYPYGYICKESIPVLKNLGFVCSFTNYERTNYIIRDPACLYGLNRYHRSGQDSTEAYFSQMLS